MAEGRVVARAADRELASQCALRAGDIVFRLGSRGLAELIEEPVTHGGIYLGDGTVHDVVGFGHRMVPLVEFFAEADDPTVRRIIRFSGPLQTEILRSLLRNIRARDFHLPTDPIPWNLFSSARNYHTATCLEYVHAQFLHSIRKLHHDRILSQADRAELTKAYGPKDEIQALIKPRPVDSNIPGWVLIVAADYLAEDIDEDLFQNRSEANDDGSLDTFTYRSFAEASSYFQALACPARPDDISVRYKEQVFRIGQASTTTLGDPIDQIGIVWAEHDDGDHYLVLIRVERLIEPPRLFHTRITFRTFIDVDLADRAIARALRHQPRGIQTLPWRRIAHIPSDALLRTARRSGR